MVFSSITFLFIFLPCILFVYYLLGHRFRNLFLTVASLLFYAWGEQKLVMLMIFSIAVNYLGGLLIGQKVAERGEKSAKAALCLFVSINVLTLVYFKYMNFFVQGVNDLGFLGSSSLEEIILPIGISFFTFQGMSYLIDIYYQRVTPQKNLISLGLYISMFPQLIAGPIVRYIDISKQIDTVRQFNTRQFRLGIKRFITGLFKKVIIANQMGFMADVVFSSTSDLGAVSHWVGIICYAFQIYFDFSGYSDMAIGLGKMFGFDFLENFDHPYISRSIQEFWRRWHISLSSWFRDYLYIPLGGNRKGISRTYFNLIIVFFITGLWHGASWNFIVWGLYHGLFLILERVWLGKMLTKNSLIGHIYAMLIVLVGWVFFRAENLAEALIYIGGMFSFNLKGNQMVFQHFDLYFVFIAALAILFSTNIKNYLKKHITNSPRTTKPAFVGSYLLYLGLFLICIFELAESNYNPFIYFRF